MLILSRAKEERILIGDDIEIVICDIRGAPGEEKVKLGINAPSNISIHRVEVLRAINNKLLTMPAVSG